MSTANENEPNEAEREAARADVEKIGEELMDVLERHPPELRRRAMYAVFAGGMRDLLTTHDLAPALQGLLGASGLAIAAVLPHGIHCESTHRNDADDKTRGLVDLCYLAMNQAIEHSAVGFKPMRETNHDLPAEPPATLNDLTSVQRETAELLAMRDLRLLASYLRLVLGPRKLSPSRIVDELVASAKEKMPAIDPRAPQMFATLVSCVTSNTMRETPNAQPGDLVRVQVPPNCTIHDVDAQRLARVRAIAAELGMVYRTAAEKLRERMTAMHPEKVGWIGAPYPAVDNAHLNAMLSELAELTKDEPVWMPPRSSEDRADAG